MVVAASVSFNAVRAMLLYSPALTLFPQDGSLAHFQGLESRRFRCLLVLVKDVREVEWLAAS